MVSKDSCFKHAGEHAIPRQAVKKRKKGNQAKHREMEWPPGRKWVPRVEAMAAMRDLKASRKKASRRWEGGWVINITCKICVTLPGRLGSTALWRAGFGAKERANWVRSTGARGPLPVSTWPDGMAFSTLQQVASLSTSSGTASTFAVDLRRPNAVCVPRDGRDHFSCECGCECEYEYIHLLELCASVGRVILSRLRVSVLQSLATTSFSKEIMHAKGV